MIVSESTLLAWVGGLLFGVPVVLTLAAAAVGWFTDWPSRWVTVQEKKLQPGIGGKANAFRIQISEDLTPVEKRRIIVHEKQHVQDKYRLGILPEAVWSALSKKSHSRWIETRGYAAEVVAGVSTVSQGAKLLSGPLYNLGISEKQAERDIARVARKLRGSKFSVAG